MNVEKILNELTVDEKIRLLSGDGDWHTFDCNGKAPAIMMTDGPHGLRKVEVEKTGDVVDSNKATCFPTASALAASFNPELIYKMAQGIATEAKREKVSIVLGCGINMKRSPFCGRNFEYFSEDPYLAGMLAASYINGVQDKGVGTSLKHFAVNSQETRRMTSNSEVDERALREIYLSAFERVVKEAKPTTVMSSYNRLNGEFSSANEHLLKDILKGEWGYKGAVISDWGATINVVKCHKNGLDLEMPDSRGYHVKTLKDAYEKGEITDAELNEYAGNILTKLSSLAEKVTDEPAVDYEKHNELAKNIENECAVLLKNDGILPIDKSKRIFVIGDLAKHVRFQGGGSSHINPVMNKSAVDSLSDEGYEIVYLRGYVNDKNIDEKLVKETLSSLNNNFDEKKDVVLFFLGLTDTIEGEGYDRTTLEISEAQIDLLERVEALVGKKNIAAVSFGGAPMDFSWDDKVSGLLHMYLGGQAVGESVAELVSGKANPSGKLAETIPFAFTDTPAWRYFANPFDDVEYRESLFIGYRYYETFNVPVKYPFGFGLSYTKFEYKDLSVEYDENAGRCSASFSIKNTGDRAGFETAEIYVKPSKQDFIRSAIELRGFKKVYLNPGEEKRVTVELDGRSFDVFDVSKNAFVTIKGTYTVCVGASVKDIRLEKEISASGEEYFRNERSLFPSYFVDQPHGMDIPREEFEKLYGKKLTDYKNRKRGDFDATCTFGDVSRKSLFGLIAGAIVGIAVSIMFSEKDKNDPAVKMVKMTIEEGNLEGVMANSGGSISAKLVDLLVYNANRKYGKAFIRAFGDRKTLTAPYK